MLTELTEHYKNNREKLVKQAGRRLNDAAYGQDCVQEAYTIAIKYFDGYSPVKGTFDQWFGRIYQRTLSRYKAFIRDKGIVKEFNVRDVEVPLEDLFQKHPNLLKECVRVVENKDHRDIINLYLKGYTAKEIRELSGFSMATTAQVIKRFKNKLSELI